MLFGQPELNIFGVVQLDTIKPAILISSLTVTVRFPIEFFKTKMLQKYIGEFVEKKLREPYSSNKVLKLIKLLN